MKHRLLEINRAAKCLTAANQQRMRDGYQKLLGLTRGVVRQANDVVQRWAKGRLKVLILRNGPGSFDGLTYTMDRLNCTTGTFKIPFELPSREST